MADASSNVLSYQTPGVVADDGLSVTLQPPPIVWELLLMITAVGAFGIGGLVAFGCALDYFDHPRHGEWVLGVLSALMVIACVVAIIRTGQCILRRFTLGHLPSSIEVHGEKLFVQYPIRWGLKVRHWPLAGLRDYSIGFRGFTVAFRRAYVLTLEGFDGNWVQIRFSPHDLDQLRRVRQQMNNVLQATKQAGSG